MQHHEYCSHSCLIKYSKFSIHIIYSKFSAETCLVYYGMIELPNLETSALCWYQNFVEYISTGYKLVTQWFYTLLGACQKIFVFSFNFKLIWCHTCERLM